MLQKFKLLLVLLDYIPMFPHRILRVSHRQHPRDSSSDEEEHLQQQSNIEVIDLTGTTAHVPSTLKPNSPRCSILPAFPTSIYDDQPLPLLLANVPCKFTDEDL